jgi:hypothetical protein
MIAEKIKCTKYKELREGKSELIISSYLFRLSPPHEGQEFVVCSASTFRIGTLENQETFIFPSDEKGNILSSDELTGSNYVVANPSLPLIDLGYKIVEPGTCHYCLKTKCNCGATERSDR